MEEYYQDQLNKLNERNKLLRWGIHAELIEKCDDFIENPHALKQLSEILIAADEEARRMSELLAAEVNKRLETERAEQDKSVADIVGDKF